MAVYYKFKSAKDYDSVAIDGHFISVGHLKEKIFELKHLGRGTDFDLVVTNAQTNEGSRGLALGCCLALILMGILLTVCVALLMSNDEKLAVVNQRNLMFFSLVAFIWWFPGFILFSLSVISEYLDEGMLIPKNTSVLIRRVPGRPRKPIVTAPVTEQEEPNVENNSDDLQAVKGSFAGADPSAMKFGEDLEWDEFGNDLYAIPENVHVQSSIPVQDATPVNKEDEESKIKALIDTPALDWQRQPSDGFGPGRGFGRGMGGRMMGGRGFGRGGFEKKTPPRATYATGARPFIQHCPTNGDPNFDIKRVKPPTGIPKSMLMATPDGSYALPSGAVAVLKPNEAAFEKEIEGMPSTRPVGDLPPELHCPLCKEVMKDAVLTSKCCFTSFCDKCIRDHIMSKSMCVCGATSILADDLLPNKTLRDTINRILESNNNSGDNGGSAFQVQDMESRNPQAKVASPTQSAASKGQQVPAPPPQREETSKIVETVEENKSATVPMKQEKGRIPKVADVSEATHDSRTVKEAVSQGSAPLADEEVQQKPLSGEAGKKKKKKKIRMPPGAADMQWRTAQDLAPENYMMPMGPSAFNPYWSGIQPGLDGFMPPYGGPVPYMGYGLSPMDVAFGGVIPHDPFGGPGCMLPYGGPPQRDLAELAMGFNPGPPIMSREEFEARKADLKRKREMERRGERELPKDREYGREGSSTVDVSSKSKSKSIPPPSSADHQQTHRHRSERHSPDRRSRDPELPRPSSKKKSDYDQSHHEDHHHRREYHDETHRHRDHHHRSSSSSYQRRSESPLKLWLRHRSLHRHPTRRRPASSPASASPRMNPQLLRRGSYLHLRSGAAVAVAAVDHDSSDDERHFKRRPSRYASSPQPAASAEEEPRHSRGSRDRERERDRGEYEKLGSYALVGLPASYQTRFVEPGATKTKYSIVIGGDNFGCGSSREHAPVALGASGVAAVVAESYARIFFRNSVATGEVYPLESEGRLCEECSTGDVVTIELGEETKLINHTTGKEYKLKPIGDAGPVIEAGGIFAYARKSG
ncbi:UNVERIFIED_CONTAM: E3 ubiquitin ligase PQT3-like [Sesamum calycinum]|uniref:E3 ubiquitin ligase PQT3-like n=1 Tax=Sesamum calycinum TaxID=2727403 RepID=A0AAW2M1B0_9LAMI